MFKVASRLEDDVLLLLLTIKRLMIEDAHLGFGKRETNQHSILLYF